MEKISNSKINYEDKRKSSTNKSHVHDNIEVSGTGHTVQISKSNPTILPSEESYLDELIRWFGRWLIGKKRNVGIPTIMVPSLASLYVIVDWIWFNFIGGLNNTPLYWIRGLSIFWLIMIFGLYGMLKRDVCPKCKKLMAMRIIKKEQVGKTKYQGRIIHNIRKTHQCDYCKHTYSEIVPEDD